ncbi:MAG: D-alanyl-D-alanine carboxypeptidase family protein [Pseudomonadota bacterium]
MAVRAPTGIAGVFLIFAVLYAGYAGLAVRLNPLDAQARFETLRSIGLPGRAAAHGERALTLLHSEDASADDIAQLSAEVALAKMAARQYLRGAELMQQALGSEWGENLSANKRILLEDKLGRALLHSNAVNEAVGIYAAFLDLAGDAAAHVHDHRAEGLEHAYLNNVVSASDLFSRAVNHTTPRIIEGGGQQAILATANQMAALGAFYATRKGSEYAAAGLLSSAYATRSKILGTDHQDAVRLTLILGPVYEKMGRLEDAERIFLDAMHAQERAKGPNSPELSLYIRLLAGVYERQERLTEAQALYEHMRRIFRDAFGAQRYAVNRERDRRSDINRPVSPQFPLAPNYTPSDLVSAADYSIPLAKAPGIDEMKVRLAADAQADPREANLPARLAQLISLCRSESGEQVLLRSGYRSYRTQSYLLAANGSRGTVAQPGTSEHQSGLAVDINVGSRFMRQSDRAYQCFEENAFRFGFILSYPPNNSYLPGPDTYEPWHWRYVGVQTAQLYREVGPSDQPQEFLAALPCYQERAAQGVFPTAGERDICLEEETLIAANANDAEGEQPKGEAPSSARILNNAETSVRSRL